MENACASATTALNQAVTYILAGSADLAMAVGIEKRMTFDPEKLSGFPELQASLPYIASTAFWSGCERDKKEQYIEKWRRQKSEMMDIPYEQTDVGVNRTPFMDHLAVKTMKGMKKYGCTQEHLARVSAKTHHHGAMNPKAQYQAVSFLEIHQTAQAGFCKAEHAAEYCSSGATSLGGEIPTNVSGGLISRGHPLGCTGLAQVYEIVTQLRGRAGKRQVKGARIGMHINGGGIIGSEEASMGAHILERV